MLTAQVPIRFCDFCTERNISEWICADCQHNLCKACYPEHTKHTKHHNIKKQADVITKKNSPQADVYCDRDGHQQKLRDLYCVPCNDLLCSMCITGHPGHNFKSVDELIKEKQNEINDYGQHLKKKKDELQKRKRQAESTENSFLDLVDKAQSDIKMQNQFLISYIQKKSFELEERLHKIKDDGLEQLGDYRRGIKDEKKSIEKLIQLTRDAKRMIVVSDLNDLIEEIKARVGKPTLTNIKLEFPLFRKNVDFSKIFGEMCISTDTEELPKAEMSEMSEEPVLRSVIPAIPLGSTNPVKVILCNMEDNTVWVGYDKARQMQQLSFDGTELKQSKDAGGTIDCAIMTSNSEILLSTGFAIKKIGQEGEIYDFADSRPCEVTGLSNSDNNEIILASLVERAQELILDTKIVMFNRKGKIVRTISRDSSNNLLFKNPSRVACARDGMIAVVNKPEENWRNELKCIDYNGNPIYTFSGKVDRQTLSRMRLSDVTKHSDESFYVCDIYNKIFIVDSSGNGHFVADIWNIVKKSPCCISVNTKDQLLVGCHDGTVLVLDVRNKSLPRDSALEASGIRNT